MEAFAYEVLRENFDKVCNSPLDPSALARTLFTKEVIGVEVLEQSLQVTRTNVDRRHLILEAVMNSGEKGVFQRFVQILLENPAHSWLGRKLKCDYKLKGGVWEESDECDEKKDGDKNSQELPNNISCESIEGDPTNENSMPVIGTDMRISIKWERGRDMPHSMSGCQAVVHGEVVYVGGGKCTNDRDQRCIYKYSPKHDSWTITSPVPSSVHKFGMTIFQNNLVLVGGSIPRSHMTRPTNRYTGELWVMSDGPLGVGWSQPYKAMPTARAKATVVAHGNGRYLVVAGGCILESGRKLALDVVEVYDSQTQEWNTGPRLPRPMFRSTSTLHQGRWYLMGGKCQGRAVWSAKLDDLVGVSSSEKEVWRPGCKATYESSAVVSFGKSLLAIGGIDTRKLNVNSTNAVSVYNPGMNVWIANRHSLPYIDTSMHATCAVVMHDNRLLVVGGQAATHRYKCVYVGTLTERDAQGKTADSEGDKSITSM